MRAFGRDGRCRVSAEMRSAVAAEFAAEARAIAEGRSPAAPTWEHLAALVAEADAALNESAGSSAKVLRRLAALGVDVVALEAQARRIGAGREPVPAGTVDHLVVVLALLDATRAEVRHREALLAQYRSAAVRLSDVLQHASEYRHGNLTNPTRAPDGAGAKTDA